MTEAIEARIEKLLRVADGTANENESATALRIAQSLADAHNLDIGTIGKTGARKDENVSKGLYVYQRSLYQALAEINHCKYWFSKGLTKGSKYTIRLLGSKMNVTITKQMADYLEGAVNNQVRDQFEPREFFTKDAHAYRHGVIDRLIERVQNKRQEEEAERQSAKREQDARMAHPGAVTENALVLISDVVEAEKKANHDYIYGEGSYDAMMSRQLARRAAQDEADEQHRQWELANPEEVARQKAIQKAESEKLLARWAKEAVRDRARREKAREDRINRHGYDPEDYKTRKATVHDNPMYQKGHRDGDSIGLDDQIDEEKRKALS